MIWTKLVALLVVLGVGCSAGCIIAGVSLGGSGSWEYPYQGLSLGLAVLAAAFFWTATTLYINKAKQ